MVMMYITAFPIVIAMRYANTDPPLAAARRHYPDLGFTPKRKLPTLSRLRRLLSPGNSPDIPLRDHIRAQIAYDALLLPAVIVLICILEGPTQATATSVFDSGSLLLKDTPGAGLFDVAFEVVSAYGCVGMSVGSFRGPASLCGDWGVLSKLLLVGIMLKGRHRGLGVILSGR